MGKVTLTFDNGPTVDTTPFVLKELSRRGLNAYFCLVAGQLLKGKEQVDIARQTQTDGHVLVNHSLTHAVALGDDPTAGHAEREIAQAHAILSEKLPDWEPRWFRPFGRGGELGRHLLSQPCMPHFRDLGYSVLLWNSVPRDWEDSEGWVGTALDQLKELDDGVIVLHDLPTGAMNHLGCFLDELLQRHETTLEVPEECVPVRDGHLVWPGTKFSQIIAGS